MSDVLDYDKTIIETLHHIEDVLVKFALQNYAAAGGVFLAFFAAKLPLRVAAPTVVVLGLVFIWAIWSNVERYKLFWKMHRIVRDDWLAGQSQLRTAFRADADCERYVTTRTLPSLTFVPMYVVNVLPALAAVVLVILRIRRVL